MSFEGDFTLNEQPQPKVGMGKENRMSLQSERAEWDQAFERGEVSEGLWRAMTSGSDNPEADVSLQRLKLLGEESQREKDLRDIRHFTGYGEPPRKEREPEFVREYRAAMAALDRECEEVIELLKDEENGTVGRYSREQALRLAEQAENPWPDIDAKLREIPTEEYAAKLAGLDLEDDRRATCPFHGGDNPSTLEVTRADPCGFYCWACSAGGSIFDFAGHLWGVGLRGDGFKEVRTRLAQEFGLI